jgi:hypothetical protein
MLPVMNFDISAKATAFIRLILSSPHLCSQLTDIRDERKDNWGNLGPSGSLFKEYCVLKRNWDFLGTTEF